MPLEEDSHSGLIQAAKEPFGDEGEVALHQANRHGVSNGFKNPQPGDLGNGFFPPPLLLFGLECAVIGRLRLAGMVNRAFEIGADSPDFPLFTALGHDGLGCELAGLVLRPIRLLLLGRLVLPDFNVAIARNRGASLLLYAVGGADFYQLRFCRDGLPDVSVQLRSVAFRVRARVRLRGHAFEEQRVVSGALWAMETSASLWSKLGIVFGERRRDEFKEDVVLDPLLKVANWEQDVLRPVSVAVLLLIASVEGFDLLLRLEFGQQESMSDTDLVFGKGFDDFGCKLRQPEARSLCVDENYV